MPEPTQKEIQGIIEWFAKDLASEIAWYDLTEEQVRDICADIASDAIIYAKNMTGTS